MYNNIISRYYFLLLSLLILSSLADPCKYRNNDYSIKFTDDKDFLDGVTDDKEAKQKCFTLSKSVDNPDKLCCYNDTDNDNDNDKCYLDDSSDNEDCPKETKIVNNNCGMAYIFQPVFPGICTEISLVQGYCCYIEYEYKYSKEGNTEEKTAPASACVKTKELNKKINSPTKQMEDYIKNFNGKKVGDDVVSKIEIKNVKCNQFFLKYFYNLIIFTTILLL